MLARERCRVHGASRLERTRERLPRRRPAPRLGRMVAFRDLGQALEAFRATQQVGALDQAEQRLGVEGPDAGELLALLDRKPGEVAAFERGMRPM